MFHQWLSAVSCYQEPVQAKDSQFFLAAFPYQIDCVSRAEK